MIVGAMVRTPVISELRPWPLIGLMPVAILLANGPQRHPRPEDVAPSEAQ
jgi:hypothetical protein